MTSPNTIIADMQAEIDALRKDRHELLSALESGRRLIELISPFEGEVTRKMDKAIASVKGGV